MTESWLDSALMRDLATLTTTRLENMWTASKTHSSPSDTCRSPHHHFSCDERPVKIPAVLVIQLH
eukprot:scaffold312966_cov25-Prasinocladus_malaysianus.AAC.1